MEAPPLSPLYKYGRRAHTQDLLKHGRLRIGTLKDYRRAEHKAGIVDPTEGKKTVYHRINGLVTYGDGSLDSQAIDHFELLHVPAGQQMGLHNFKFIRHEEAPDCFVYCASSRLSRETMAQFDGADSCYRIVDEVRFWTVLTEALHAASPVGYRVAADVQYVGREEAWSNSSTGVHPAFMKEERYAPQWEVRMAWQPLHRPIEPLLIVDQRLSACCVAVDVPPA